jgi:hypothetical protein
VGIDDHAIDSLRVWFDLEYTELVEEWKSGQYAKLSECPSFKSATAFREAMNVLIKACYLPEYVKQYLIPPLSKRIREDLEIEEFWANHRKEAN